MFIVYDLYHSVHELGRFKSKKDAYNFKRHYEKETNGLCYCIVSEYVYDEEE